jgi:hypothetical protein
MPLCLAHTSPAVPGITVGKRSLVSHLGRAVTVFSRQDQISHRLGVLRLRRCKQGSLVVTFYGTTAHQVGEGKMQGPLRREVGLGQGPHSLAHLQEQLSTLAAHSPSPGQLRQERKKTMEGGPSPRNLSPLLSPLLHLNPQVWSLSNLALPISYVPQSVTTPKAPGLRTPRTLVISVPGELLHRSPGPVPSLHPPSSPALIIRPSHKGLLSPAQP